MLKEDSRPSIPSFLIFVLLCFFIHRRALYLDKNLRRRCNTQNRLKGACSGLNRVALSPISLGPRACSHSSLGSLPPVGGTRAEKHWCTLNPSCHRSGCRKFFKATLLVRGTSGTKILVSRLIGQSQNSMAALFHDSSVLAYLC